MIADRGPNASGDRLVYAVLVAPHAEPLTRSVDSQRSIAYAWRVAAPGNRCLRIALAPQ